MFRGMGRATRDRTGRVALLDQGEKPKSFGDRLRAHDFKASPSALISADLLWAEAV
jgi:hypothetical protein